jgi:hypothetical protein
MFGKVEEGLDKDGVPTMRVSLLQIFLVLRVVLIEIHFGRSWG